MRSSCFIFSWFSIAVCGAKFFEIPCVFIISQVMVKRVVKGYMKNNKKLDLMVKASSSKIKERHFNETDFENINKPCRSNLTNFLDPVLNKVRDAKGKILNGEISIKDFIETMTDDQINSLTNIFKRRSGGYTEDRIIQMCYVMFNEMGEIDTAISHLHAAKKELLETMVLAYGKQYHKGSDASAASFDNETFSEELRLLQRYRARLRVESGEQNNSEEAVALCMIM